MGYLIVFFPQLTNPHLETITIIAILWLFTTINIRGIGFVAVVQSVTTILKLMPLIAVATLGWIYFHPEYLTHSFNITGKSHFSAFSYASTLTLWAFIGVESATVPAGSVESPQRNIPLATLFGTLIAVILYVASSTVVMGMVPTSVLVNSVSPFAAAAKMIFGEWGSWIIAAGAVISCAGGLNGWILVQGQIAMAAADDHLFPRVFSIRNKAGVPVWSLVITSILMSFLLFFTSNPNLVSQFQLIILIASSATLIAYFYTSAAQIILLVNQGTKKNISKIHLVIASLAGVYSFWALFGSGQNIIFYVMMLLLSSFPLYAIAVWRKRNIAQNQ